SATRPRIAARTGAGIVAAISTGKAGAASGQASRSAGGISFTATATTSAGRCSIARAQPPKLIEPSEPIAINAIIGANLRIELLHIGREAALFFRVPPGAG